MSSPKADKILFAYIAVAPHAVSLVLIWIDGGIQWPIYYVSKSLHEVEVRYLLTQLPLKSVLWSVDYKGRIAKWSTVLGAFDIKYMPRTSIKGQSSLI